MKKIKLEKLLEEDWFRVKQWSGYLMLEKGEERMLYDEKKEKVVLRYKFDDEGRLCGLN